MSLAASSRLIRWPFLLMMLLISNIGPAVDANASGAGATATRPDSVVWHLADRALFTRLALTIPTKAWRLEPLPDSLSVGHEAVPASYRKAEELTGRPPRVLSRLLRMFAASPWVRAQGWTSPTPPSLALQWGTDSLGIDMLVSLQSRSATLHRVGEGTLAAQLPESLRTDLAWCLWGLDEKNPEALPVVRSEMRRRGLSPSVAPPDDIGFLQGLTRPVPDISGRDAYDQPAEPVSQVRPAYPEMAREAKIEGTVLLRVLVGRDGRVHDVKVVRSVNYLDAAARDAVMKWVYKPAVLQGKPIPVWIDVPVTFP